MNCKDEMPTKDASNTTAEELAAWDKYGQYWWRNGYDSGFEHGGVPSEATPSKEEKMIGSTGRIHKKTHDCETAGCRPAPAPEVQGTPKSKSYFEKMRDAITPEMSEKIVREVEERFRPAPVGTPQKETPTMPYGAGAQNFGVKTYAETADQIRAATFVGTDKFVQTDTQQLPASVPEGVQGKEPQTFEQRYAEKDQALEERARAYENTDGSDSVYSLLAGFAFQERKSAYLDGEAAGRRSAITEMKEWILTVREDPFDPWSAGYNKGYDAVSKKCAELLEKTK